MGLIAKDNGSSFTPAPEGTHVAICCQVIDLGTQHSEFYNKDSHKVLVGWELPNEKMDSGEPFLVWKRYTLSLGDKATLRAHLEAWRGRKFTADELESFHLKNIVGKPCMLSIIHKTQDNRTFTEVSAVMALPKGTTVPASEHAEIMFDIDDWNDAVFEKFSDNLKKTIMSSPEAIQRKSAGTVAVMDGSPDDIDEDSIPF